MNALTEGRFGIVQISVIELELMRPRDIATLQKLLGIIIRAEKHHYNHCIEYHVASPSLEPLEEGKRMNNYDVFIDKSRKPWKMKLRRLPY